MQISKEKRMRIMLTILSVVDFGYCFDNITYITVILSCILVLCSIGTYIIIYYSVCYLQIKNIYH